jgi:hypothetical protein
MGAFAHEKARNMTDGPEPVLKRMLTNRYPTPSARRAGRRTASIAVITVSGGSRSVRTPPFRRIAAKGAPEGIVGRIGQHGYR